MTNVFDRIVAMLDKPESSSAVASLIDDAKGERDRQETAAAKLDNLALNPRTSIRDVEKARKDREEALFQVKRLEASIAELQALLETAKEEERAAQDAAFYKEVKAERDALAKDLEQYPELAGKLAGILSRLDANAKRCREANVVRPEGAEWLASAEDLACGAPRSPTGSSRLALAVKLPAFRGIGLPGAGQETGLRQLARYLLQGPLAPVDWIAMELLRESDHGRIDLAIALPAFDLRPCGSFTLPRYPQFRNETRLLQLCEGSGDLPKRDLKRIVRCREIIAGGRQHPHPSLDQGEDAEFLRDEITSEA